MISLKDIAFCDLQRELAITRRVLDRLPEDRFAWKPHPKSMSLGDLAMHVANLVQWLSDTVQYNELDMSSPPPMRNKPEDKADVLRTFDANVKELNSAMAKPTNQDLTKTWTLREGKQVLHQLPRHVVMRLWCLNHLVHHRAQLCLYLRLNDVPVPAVYFNSADEPEWVFE